MKTRNTKTPISCLAAIFGALLFAMSARAENKVHVSPAPEGEPLSAQFKVRAEQANVPVYLARVCSLSAEERKRLGPPVESQTTTTAFASFDLEGQAKVTVTCNEEVKSVNVLPITSGLRPEVSGKTLTFTVNKPGPLTIEVNGDWIHSLHLFVDPVEKDIPDPKDPKVIYFGPGVHHVQSMTVNAGQTVYVAGGAIVYGDGGGNNPHDPIFRLQGANITLRGRGIIDGSLCPWHTRSIVAVVGSDIHVEGVTLRDSSGFTLPVRRSDRVKIENVKIFGWRGNSDGMDLCNSRQVEVTGSFLRTFDDLVVLKTDKGQGELRDVTVKNCVLWNEFAHALSLGAELREPLTNVLFTDCDVIHDKGREWLLRVYHCDSAPVKNVTFDHIRIEEARRLMSVWIGKAVWSKESERGHIDGVTFKNIESVTPISSPYADLVGFDADHAVHDVHFEHVIVGQRELKPSDVRQNAFVSGVTIAP
ncbi:glycoside hydrolase family 28 [Chthoniobacter flavus Ellin428]|uniref:Glycoside hydrolase family 28 n=2 Tax=Chthoniobacter flavus TaxID=191863 RepID=B4D7J6_9BACT|nr:glycosyl hydrolase family 28 protein [Chthoniobacter flavus]EDY17613.1 glycoside hydrolase family 28 [Chthoniobacter flavus Ellin428]TCO92358.1 glycosyl hydrolase family 28 [Chthoniobacter flavus]